MAIPSHHSTITSHWGHDFFFFFSSAFALLPSLGSEETERSLKNRKSNHATLLFKMFSEFPWNPESNANVSESCESNLTSSRLKETLPRLEGTRDDVQGHLWLSQLEEGRVLVSSGWRPNILP